MSKVSGTGHQPPWCCGLLDGLSVREAVRKVFEESYRKPLEVVAHAYEHMVWKANQDSTGEWDRACILLFCRSETAKHIGVDVEAGLKAWEELWRG